MIGVEAHYERAQKYLAGIPGAAERAMARAMSAAIKGAEAEALERIEARYEVNTADVKARLSLMLARPSSLSAKLSAKSPSLPLSYFPHSPSRPGTGGRGRPSLTATVLRGSPKTVGGAFVAKLGTKSRIAMRTGAKTATGKDAMRVLFSVPIAEMLGVASVRVAVEARAVELLDEKLGAEIDRELEKS